MSADDCGCRPGRLRTLLGSSDQLWLPLYILNFLPPCTIASAGRRPTGTLENCLELYIAICLVVVCYYRLRNHCSRQMTKEWPLQVSNPWRPDVIYSALRFWTLCLLHLLSQAISYCLCMHRTYLESRLRCCRFSSVLCSGIYEDLTSP